MVPINSARVVSYSTSIDTISVSVTIIAIFDVQFDKLKIGQLKAIHDQST